APVPQRSLLPATPSSSAPTHNIITFASCCCSALVPLLIVAACNPTPPAIPAISYYNRCNPLSQPPSHSCLPCCSTCLQPSLPCFSSPMPSTATSLLQPTQLHLPPSLLVVPSSATEITFFPSLTHHYRNCFQLQHFASSAFSPTAVASSRPYPYYRCHCRCPRPPLKPSSSSPVVDLAIPCRCFLWLFHPSLALLGRCSTHLPLLPSSFSSQPSIVPSPSTVVAAPDCRCCLLFNRSLSHLYHRRCSLSNLSLPTATIAAPPIAHPSSTNASSAVVSPASLALSHAFLPPHLHHHHCQLPDPVLSNLFPATAAIASHNHCPSPISSYASSITIAANPYRCHLSPVTAATHLCLLPCCCYPRCHSRFQSRPCRCTSLLPPLQLLATTVAPTISNQLFDILVILTSIISLRSSPITSTMQTHAPDSTVEKRTEHR
ncbi:hypothetical protein BHE74_00052237, partial [Ensete ventricosum]